MSQDINIRKVKKTVTGQPTVDGAGVHLVRVLGIHTVKDFDPWLMLDSFDSKNPNDYIAGFPPHPHRGIETITYLARGEMTHGDSLGNKGVIHSGESQWMTAGSGIIHEEMPQPSEHMLGVQLWLNLPQKDKMAVPKYFTITPDMIPEAKEAYGTVKVLSGTYQGVSGTKPDYVQATILDVDLRADSEISIPISREENVFAFLLDGDAIIEGETYQCKTAVLFSEGDMIKIKAPKDKSTRFIVCAGKPLQEEIAWGGPIVMNTREELNNTFKELDEGTFIKHKAVGE